MRSIFLALFLVLINLTGGHTSQHTSELTEDIDKIARATQKLSLKPASFQGPPIHDYLLDELLTYILSFDSTKWTAYCIVSRVDKSSIKQRKRLSIAC